MTVRRDLAVSVARQGRSRISMIRLAKTSRRVVVPWAPTIGNMLLASEAPDWMEAMAINSSPIENNVEARLRGWSFIARHRPGCFMGWAIYCAFVVLASIYRQGIQVSDRKA